MAILTRERSATGAPIAILLLLFLFCQSSAAAQHRPNILWITCEDLSPFLPAYGDSTIQTPNLSWLAGEGIRFTRMFSTYGVCGPSRSAIITGMYPTAIGAMDMRTGTARQTVSYLPDYEAVPPPKVKCFTEYLRAAGYYCVNNAKTDYQFKVPVTAWDENGKNASWRHRKPGQPFFAVFNIEATHESNLWTRADQPLRVDPDKVPVPPYFPENNPVIRKDLARMYDNIMRMDRAVGHLLDELKADHLLDSTIIIFCSDHGGPIAWYKREVYDRGTHIPFIVRFPDQKNAGTKEEELHSLVDIAPTVLSLAGLHPPAYLQGQAFLGKEKAPHPRAFVFTARDRMDEQYDLIRAVRNKRYQYVRNYDPDIPRYHDNAYRLHMPMMQEILRLKAAKQLTPALKSWFARKPAEELYDLQTDPYELHNLAAEHGLADVLTRMRAALTDWEDQTRDKGFMQEIDLVKLMWPGLQQPVTDPPNIQIQPSAGKAKRMQITCSTPGASIAYRWNNDPPGYWHLYTHPVAVQTKNQAVSLRTKAIRIGYKESKEVVYPAADNP